MKVFLDTNVYIAEALLGGAAESMLIATTRASWRIFCERLRAGRGRGRNDGTPRLFNPLGKAHPKTLPRRAVCVNESSSHHEVPGDPADSPILRAAIGAGVDYLVSNDRHLLELDPYEGVRIISMTAYFELLTNEGLLSQT